MNIEKAALVTGASRGIGKAIAEEFASRGYAVAVVYASDPASADEVCRRLRERYGAEAKTWQCDVADYDACGRTVSDVLAAFGRIDVLVNNAGITRDGLAATMKEEDFDRVLAVDLKGAYSMIRHCLRSFVRQKSGSIVNVSSVSGIFGNPGQCNYAAAKAGLIGLTRSIAREYASRGIRCNAVAPGYIGTDMTRGLADEALLAQIPMKRMGRPEDVAKAAAFLAEAEYITGEVLRVDGGLL